MPDCQVDTVHIGLFMPSPFYMTHHVCAWLWALLIGAAGYSDMTSLPILLLADITIPAYMVRGRGGCNQSHCADGPNLPKPVAWQPPQ